MAAECAESWLDYKQENDVNLYLWTSGKICLPCKTQREQQRGVGRHFIGAI